MAGQRSHAVQRAIEIAADAGFVITAGEFEDWRAAGFAPRVAQHGLGRGKGSTSSTYTDEECAWIVAAADVASRVRSTPDRICAAFALGCPIDETVYRNALRDLLGATDFADDINVWDHVDQLEAGLTRKSRIPFITELQRAARVTLRSLGVKLESRAEPTGQIMRDFASLILTGEPDGGPRDPDRASRSDLVGRAVLKFREWGSLITDDDRDSDEFRAAIADCFAAGPIETLAEGLDSVPYDVLHQTVIGLHHEANPFPASLTLWPGQTPTGDQLVAPLAVGVFIDFGVERGLFPDPNSLPAE
jgi:hypothetical protein